MANIDELLEQASEIRDANEEKENTALRVGTMLVDILQHIAGFIDRETLRQILQEYASLSGTGLVNWRQSRCVFLATMGTELDNVDGGKWEYTSHDGDIVFNPSSRTLRIEGEVNTYFPAPGVIYVNAHTAHLYKWDVSTQKMTELVDSSSPTVIDYRNAPAFADIPIGATYYFLSQSSGYKIGVKVDANNYCSFAIDPKKVYAFRDTLQTAVWNADGQTWTVLSSPQDGSAGVSVRYISSTKTTVVAVGGSSTNPGVTPTPTITVEDVPGGKRVTMGASSGATIYYTTDGSTPTGSSAVYSGPISLTTAGTRTIKAIAKASGKDMSDTAEEEVSITATAQPTISSSTANGQTIITASRSGATVFLSTDGANWTSGIGSASVAIAQTSSQQQVTVYARAESSGHTASQQVQQSVTVPAVVVVNNIFSGTSSSEIPAITINGTTYTNSHSDTEPYIVNAQVSGGYEWSIDFGNTAFADAIAFGGTGTQSIFHDGTTDYKARVTGITHLPSSWSAIGAYAFWCSGCAVLNFGDAIQTIGENACVAVKANPLTVPDTVATIGKQAFRSSTSKSIYLGAANISYAAFDSNVSVTDITFGSGVKKIGTYLFMQRALTHLTTATFLGATPPTFDDQNLFGASQADGFKIVVPKGSLNAYKTALTDWVDVIEEAQ